MPFTMNDWAIDFPWNTPMENLLVYDTPFNRFLLDAMLNLVDSIGEPLRFQANLLTNQNGPLPPHLFTGADMERYLRDGDFKFGPGGRRLLIAGPSEDMLTNWGVLGRAPLETPFTIRINIYYFANEVNRGNSPYFPPTPNGYRNFKTAIGKTILHEMLHQQGFYHPARGNAAYNPTLPYFRTLPEVAELAYYNLRSDTFPAGTAPGTVLNLAPNASGEGVVKCDTTGSNS
jgi:hypothetical protein